MKRSVQEIIELAVFGLVALLIGTGGLWLAGWVLGGIGWLLQLISGLLWSLLRFIVPVALAAGLVYLLVRWLQGQARRQPPVTVTPEAEPVAPPPVAGGVKEVPVTAGEAAAYDPDDSWHPPLTAEEAVIEEAVIEGATVEAAAAADVAADVAAADVAAAADAAVESGTVDVFAANDGENALRPEGSAAADAGLEAGLPATDSREDT